MTVPGEGMSGGCQCGAVRFRLSGALESPNICHCRMCQKAHGAPVVSWASAARAAVDWTRGEPSVFRSSGKAVRLFCNRCGTPLAFQLDDADHIDIALAALDEPAEVTPRLQTGIEACMPWFAGAHALPEEEAGDCPGTRQHPDHDTDHWPEGGTR